MASKSPSGRARARFPVFGVMEPQNTKDEKIFQFDEQLGCVAVWHKETKQREKPWSSILRASPDVKDQYWTGLNEGGLETVFVKKQRSQE